MKKIILILLVACAQSASGQGLQLWQIEYALGQDSMIISQSDGELIFKPTSAINLSLFNDDLGAGNYWSLNGSDLYPISASYFVGVGNTNPTTLFHATHSGAQNMATFENLTSFMGVNFDAASGNDNVLNFNEVGTQKAKFGYDSSDSAFKIIGGTGAFSGDHFTIQDNGRVGIGAISLADLFEVHNSNSIFAVGDIQTTHTSTGTSGSHDFIITDQDNNSTRASLQVKGNAGAIETLFAASNGYVGFGTTSPEVQTDVDNSRSLDFSNDLHTGSNLMVRSTGIGAGDGNATGLIEFGKHDGSFRRSGSGIAGIQTDLDADKVGLGFYTSPSSASSQTLAQKMLLSHAGDLRLNSYGSGTFTGTETYYSAWDGSGNVIEKSLAEMQTAIDTDTDTNLTQEEVEDYAGAMATGNTETLITVTYQDVDGTMDYVVEPNLSNYVDDLTHTTDTDTQLTQEQVEDYIGGMVTGNTETDITVTYQDVDGTLDFVVTGSGDNLGDHTATEIIKSETFGVQFNGTSQTLIGDLGGLTFDVPSLDTYDFEINNIRVGEFTSSTIEFDTDVFTLNTADHTVNGNLRFSMETDAGGWDWNMGGTFPSHLTLSPTSSAMDLSLNGKIFIDNGNSRVGINDTSPAEALDVTGTIHTTANLETDFHVIVDGNINMNGASSRFIDTNGSFGSNGDIMIDDGGGFIHRSNNTGLMYSTGSQSTISTAVQVTFTTIKFETAAGELDFDATLNEIEAIEPGTYEMRIEFIADGVGKLTSKKNNVLQNWFDSPYAEWDRASAEDGTVVGYSIMELIANDNIEFYVESVSGTVDITKAKVTATRIR